MDIGTEVICIDDALVIARHTPGEIGPVKGCVYTIRGFYHSCYGTGVYLEQIRNRQRQYADKFGEPCFAIRRFRPLTKDDLRVSAKTKEMEPA